MSFLRHYLFAIQSYTRVPVTGTLAEWVGSSPDMLRASAAHFPGVGWLVGIVACAAFALLGLALPDTPLTPLAAAVGCTVATAWMTGAVHETGLARTADGLCADVPAPRALEAMRDSRIGHFGALALALALLAKVSLLAVLAAQSPTAVMAALLAGHVLSRFWPLLLARALPYFGEAGVTGMAGRLEPSALGIAAGWSLAAMLVALLAQGPVFAIFALLGSALALLWIRKLFNRRLQGFNDHGLGATQQACETAFYLGAAIGLGIG